MEKIGGIIGRVVPALREGKPCTEGQAGSASRQSGDIESLWAKIVDERLVAHSYAEAIRNGTLVVRVDSSCFLAALKMQKAGILERLKSSGCGNIKKIEFRI